MFNYPIGSGNAPAKKPMAKKPMAPEQEMQAGGEEPEEGSAVAEEHGPAHEVHITHDHGAHHVHSMHPDGHEHHSDHASVEEAHEHGKQLASGGEEQGDDDDWGEEG